MNTGLRSLSQGPSTTEKRNQFLLVLMLLEIMLFLVLHMVIYVHGLPKKEYTRVIWRNKCCCYRFYVNTIRAPDIDMQQHDIILYSLPHGLAQICLDSSDGSKWAFRCSRCHWHSHIDDAQFEDLTAQVFGKLTSCHYVCQITHWRHVFRHLIAFLTLHIVHRLNDRWQHL